MEKPKGDLLKQAQHIWTMLDDLVDSDPDSYKKFIDGKVKEGEEMFSPPRPYMCVVTELSHPRKEKLFINIASWSRVPKPKTSGSPIPVIADPIERRKQGKEKMSLINCAFHLSVLDECCQSDKQKDMLVNLALDFIEHNCEVQVSRQYQILPDRNFKGNPQTLRSAFRRKKQPEETVADYMNDPDSLLKRLGELATADAKVDTGTRANSAPKVGLKTEEIPRTSALIQEISSSDGKLVKPECELSVKEASGSRARRIVAKISLPNVQSFQECLLDISEDDLTLEVPSKYQIQLQLPELINESQISAKFNNKTSTLTVTMPTLHQGEI